MGEEREEPNQDPKLPPPERQKLDFRHPFDSLSTVLGPARVKQLKYAIICVCCCFFIGMFVLLTSQQLFVGLLG